MSKGDDESETQTYNITMDKAQKLLLAFPHPVMYVGGPPGSLIEEFVKVFKTSGYTVVSTSMIRRMCKTDESFMENIRKRIHDSTDVIIVYGSLDLEMLKKIFENVRFAYIYCYPKKEPFEKRVSKMADDKKFVEIAKSYCGDTKSTTILKKHSQNYKAHLAHFEKMLVVLE